MSPPTPNLDPSFSSSVPSTLSTTTTTPRTPSATLGNSKPSKPTPTSTRYFEGSTDLIEETANTAGTSSTTRAASRSVSTVPGTIPAANRPQGIQPRALSNLSIPGSQSLSSRLHSVVATGADSYSSSPKPRHQHSSASASNAKPLAHHDSDMKKSSSHPARQPPASTNTEPSVAPKTSQTPSSPAPEQLPQRQHQVRASPPPPLILSQGKRPSGESTGAGELEDIISPHKKARIHFRPSPTQQQQKQRHAPPPAGYQHATTKHQDRGPPLLQQLPHTVPHHYQHHHQPQQSLPPHLKNVAGARIPATKPEDGKPGGHHRIRPLPNQFFSSQGSKLMSALHALPGFSAPAEAAATAAAAAAGTMLTKVEDVTTNRLPKGTVTTASPCRSSSTPGSWSSVDVSMTSRSPDSRSIPPAIQSFQAIGVIELLEQDSRPVLVVDLTGPASSPPATPMFQVLYANPVLRGTEGLLDALSIAPAEDPEAMAQLTEFAQWILTNASEGQDALNMTGFSTVDFAGLRWFASTLKGRFRVIYGQKMEISAEKSPSDESRITAIHGEHGSNTTIIPDDFVPTQDLPAAVIDLTRDQSASPITENFDESGYFGEGGIPIPPPLEEDQIMGQADAFTLEILQNRMTKVEKPSFDWTRIAVCADTPEHFKFARSIDWASTPLGPIDEWSDELRIMSNMVMASPHPVAMYWGPEFVTIYNEAYILLAGEKHPQLMGQRYRDAWAEIWDEIEPVFEEACRSGLATMKHEDRLFIYRHRFLEETWFSWSIVPLVGPDGSIVGLLNPAFEDTKRKITERRMHTLREVGVQIATARDLKSFWLLFCKGLAFNEVDVPFALVYSINEENGSEVSSVKSGSITHAPKIYLEGAIGTPDGHHCAPKHIDLANSEEGFAQYIRQSVSLGTPVVLRKKDGTFPEALVQGLEWRGYGQEAHTIVVFPIRSTTGCESTVGFAVMATNPRRPFNQDFELFVHLLSRQLDTATASIILFEEEIKRGQRAARLAALDRQELQKLLHIRTQEAEASEYKFTRMAEFAPVGMFIANSEGDMSYCNDTWWELSRHPRSEENIHTWMQSVHDDDLPSVKDVWQKLVKQKATINHEFRFKYMRERNGHTMDAWVLLSAFPERCETNHCIKCIFGCITDISQQKWAESVQIQRREEALELKRQQENFIDITSHEMRNPLSAILQCADEITNALSELRNSGGGEQNLERVIEGCLDAAATVSLCAGHQKRIVDDVLTLSKLDSQLLLVTPVDVQPVDIVQQVLKMFESELNTNEITANFRIEKSFQDLQIDWVKLDPSRLMQVLINLMTNAIKFTQSCEIRNITLNIGASHDAALATPAPYSTDSLEASGHPPKGGVSFFPRRHEEKEDLVCTPEWGTGDPINLHFSIADTGEGVGENEIQLLFQRFSQATPRTHVRYGGSGLGLFISRILTELQGGQIGVTSEKGIGSTFAFYIKSRKSEAFADHKAARKADEAVETVTTTNPDTAKALLASSNTAATTSAPSAATILAPAEGPIFPPPTPVKPAPPRSLSTPSRDTATGDLDRPSCVSPPIMTLGSSSFSPTPQQQLPRRALNERPMSVRDILVVEDNLVNQKVLRKQLRNAGHKTQVANHGGEALQVIMRSRFWTGTPPATPALPGTPSSRSGRETNPFDHIVPRATSSNLSRSPRLTPVATPNSDEDERPNISVILMDLEMPVMDGMACSRRIRELEAMGRINRHIPIIAVTAYVRPEQINDAKEAGIDDVISKPFRIHELMPKVEENIARWEDTLADLNPSGGNL
ncbi:histidine kinase hhk13p [Zalerion maritima]|uniref:Histidine kinase hhk13p n=1 Tax=Zalerion maritima TaxID=339359 RepID=A0AAD5WVD3_9PEZI|nr:histidine kinase hhk13p [Zalerion maritima]